MLASLKVAAKGKYCCPLICLRNAIYQLTKQVCCRHRSYLLPPPSSVFLSAIETRPTILQKKIHRMAHCAVFRKIEFFRADIDGKG